MTRRLLLGLRFALLAGVLVAAVGIAGHVTARSPVGGTWLTTTLGPTAYVLIAHPRSAASRARSGLLGHGTGILAGLAALAVFGLWRAPSIAETHAETLPQAGAQAVAVALTLLVLTLLDAHHAPAAATTLLVSSGIAAPGKPIIGLVIGLVIVLALAPLLARLPGERDDTADVRGGGAETPMG